MILFAQFSASRSISGVISPPAYDTPSLAEVPGAPSADPFQRMKKIWRDSGRLLIIFCIGAVGTVLGALAAFGVLGRLIPYCKEICGVMTGSYIGGGVNFAALANSFAVPKGMIAATTVADNMNMNMQ